MEPVFFADAAALRAWLAAHHATAPALLLGLPKKGSGRAGPTYHEALDEALCVGWIDGVRRSLGADAYSIRFTPRTARSIWSAVNIVRATALVAEGRMTPAGLAAFAQRDEARSRAYSYESAPRALDPAYEAELRAAPRAWAFWSAQPPGYRRLAAFWVMGAKREATRRRRFDVLRALSDEGTRITDVMGPGKRKDG